MEYQKMPHVKTEREKHYVKVLTEFDEDGRMTPKEITFTQVTHLKIDRVTDVCRRAADVGGVGDRYECEIAGGNQTFTRYLWFEKGRWFVEAPKKTVDS